MLDHPMDLLADFLRFYGVRPDALSGPEFLALAWRVGAYGGVIQRRQEQLAPRSNGVPAGATRVDGTKAAISADPLLSEVVSFGEG